VAAANLTLCDLDQCGAPRSAQLQSVMPDPTQTVSQYLSDARLAISHPALARVHGVAAARTSTAKWSCDTALKDIKGGYVDAASVQKCDRFYQRFGSLR
jgi:hypothetical protein